MTEVVLNLFMSTFFLLILSGDLYKHSKLTKDVLD